MGVRVDMNIELLLKLQQQQKLRGTVQVWGGVQSGCEHRIEVIVKMQKTVGVGSSLGWVGVEELKLL